MSLSEKIMRAKIELAKRNRPGNMPEEITLSESGALALDSVYGYLFGDDSIEFDSEDQESINKLSGYLSSIALSSSEDGDGSNALEDFGNSLFVLQSEINDKTFDSIVKGVHKFLSTKVEKAKWDAAYINALPDMAFAHVAPGEKEDSDGRAIPKSRRSLPHHTDTVTDPGENSSVDLIHLRNALARVSQTKLAVKDKAAALAHLQAHAKALGVGSVIGEKAAQRILDAVAFEKMGIELFEGEEFYAFQRSLREAFGSYVDSMDLATVVSTFMPETNVKKHGYVGDSKEYRPHPWVEETYADFIIAECRGNKFKVMWKRDAEGTFSFGEVIQVEEKKTFEPVKKSENRDFEKTGEATLFHSYDGKIQKDDDEPEIEGKFVLGVVLEPNDGVDGDLKPDTDNDIYSADDIQKACHRHALKGFPTKSLHQSDATGRITIVENFIAPQDIKYSDDGDTIKKGSWIQAAFIQDDELQKSVADGTLTGWSVGGSAIRTPVQ